MRREYNVIDKEPLPPFYENLVFWAPLTEGDLTDHISGVEPTTDAGCSVTWDSDKGMYLLNTVGYLKSSLKYDCLIGELAANSDTTFAIDIEESSITSIYNMIFGIPPYEYSLAPYNYNLLYFRHDRYNSSISNRIVGRLVLVCYNRILTFYLNNEVVKVLDWSSVSTIRIDIGGVRINETASNVSYNSIYAKNARIYNRALTAKEVAQL